MAYSTINKPNQHFNTVTYVADDTSPRTLTGFGHQPDFVWVKHRGSGSVSHTLVDRVRGGDKMLASNGVGGEDTKSHGEITSWNADGITVADGTNGTYPRLYFNDLDPFGSGGGNYVAWSWKANGAGVTNTQGTITSTVSANTTSGFSIVSYTGNGTSGATIGHGLGAVPKMIIVKNRNGTNQWLVYHASLGATKYLILETTGGAGTASTLWNDTTPTTSLFTVGNSSSVNGSTLTYIAYCFAEVKGYSKFGSYVGNGNSTNGPFIYTGFAPRFVMIKCTSAVSDWFIWDSKREPNNLKDLDLYPNNSSAEDTALGSNGPDFLSNGFKFQSSGTTASEPNVSGATYIYMAFAEQPLVGTNNVPATAR